MPGRVAICANPACRQDVPDVAGQKPPRFCADCMQEYAEVEADRAAMDPEVTAQPKTRRDGRVAPTFLDDQETW